MLLTGRTRLIGLGLLAFALLLALEWVTEGEDIAGRRQNRDRGERSDRFVRARR